MLLLSFFDLFRCKPPVCDVFCFSYFFHCCCCSFPGFTPCRVLPSGTWSAILMSIMASTVSNFFLNIVVSDVSIPILEQRASTRSSLLWDRFWHSSVPSHILRWRHRWSSVSLGTTSCSLAWLRTASLVEEAILFCLDPFKEFGELVRESFPYWLVNSRNIQKQAPSLPSF